MKFKISRVLCIAVSALMLVAMTPASHVQASETDSQASELTEAAPAAEAATAEALVEAVSGEAASAITVTAWEAMKNYLKGDIVSYNNAYYECIQPHMSLGGWEPANVPALWVLYTGELPSVPDPDPEPGDILVTGITLSQSAVTLEIGKNTTLTAAVAPENATNKTVTWKSSNPSAASVIDGTVTAIAAGSTTITGTAGNKSAVCEVTVKAAEPQPMPDDSPLPGRVLTGYWQNFDNGATCLRLSDVPVEYNVICISFAEATKTPGEITFILDSNLSKALGGYTTADFKADVITAHSKGQKVLLSIGGELGNVIINTPTAAQNFANSAFALMQEYGFDGIDIDLEHGIDVPNLANALHLLSQKAGPGFILTMAPQTMDVYTYNATYLRLAREVSDILTIMNTQYYNSGGMPGYGGANYNQGTIGFLNSLATTQLESGLRPDQVGIGLPAVPRAAGGGYQDPANVAAAIESLVYGTQAGGFTPPKAYNNLRGAMDWSINWDATNNYKFAKTISACFAKLPPITTN